FLGAGDDGPPALLFPPRNSRERRGVRFHSRGLLGRTNRGHRAGDAPWASAPPGRARRKSGGPRRPRRIAGERVRGRRTGSAPPPTGRSDRPGGRSEEHTSEL